MSQVQATTSKSVQFNQQQVNLAASRNKKFLESASKRQYWKELAESVSPSYVLGYN